MRITWLFIYSVICGALLTFYSNIQDLSKFLFSIGAIYAGIRFFRQFESKSLRIWFIVLSVLLYFIFNIAFAFSQYMKNI
ncbi:hypothetical protein [Paenibacillus eucommiae]|uniref:Signal transduction histidine kinase n=1 Tax=Paenibacillus eucommiae TaxID=1355755 RepID=A0ABS4IV29_9BACL|nr:hypothetical protein [Paenibacillus eucommiae]MBP1991428.1 signal transduction histidine kinase [Paenibacillus eucommiae]